MKKRNIIVIILLAYCIVIYSKTEIRIAQIICPSYHSIDTKENLSNFPRLLRILEAFREDSLIFEERPYLRAVNELKYGDLDLVFGLAKTPEYSEYFHYFETFPLIQDSIAFYVSNQKNLITNYNDLKDKCIDILNGYKYNEIFDNDPDLVKFSVNKCSNALLKLMRGRCDVVALPEIYADYLIAQQDMEIIKSPFKLKAYPAYIALSKKSKNFEIIKRKIENELKIFISLCR